jgi:hypothetical protein
MDKACSANGGRGIRVILVGKPEGKTPLGRPRRKWVDSVKKGLKNDKMGWYGLD